MNAFLISLIVAALALVTVANVIPSNEQNPLDGSSSSGLDTASMASPENGTSLNETSSGLDISNSTSSQSETSFNESSSGLPSLNETSSNLDNVNATSSLNGTSFNLGEAVTEFLLALKKVMPCGNEALAMPPMAPLRYPNAKLNFSEGPISLNGEIKNLMVVGLDDFVIINLATNESTNRTETDILHKDIQILGTFDLKVEADVSGYKHVQPLKGFINFQMLNTRVSSAMTISPNEVGGTKISDVEYSMQIGDIKVSSLDTELSVAVNNFVNRYIRDFTLLFLQTNHELIGQVYAQYVDLIGNQALYNVPFESLASALEVGIKLLKSLECNQ